MKTLVHESSAHVAAAVGDRIIDLIGGADGRFTLGLSGGTTPRAAYEYMRRHGTDWDRVEAWLSDERWVPPEHERSNGAQAASAFTDHVPITFHRPPWDDHVTPQDAALQYDQTLRSIHAGRAPDVIMLGMGDDGHTASLFPETSALEVRDRWYVANRVPQFEEYRLTATYPLLWAASLLVVMVTGAAKAATLAQCLAGDHPAGRLGEGDASVEWHVDREAASLVS